MRGLFVPMGHVPPGYLQQLVNHLVAHDPGLVELALTDTRPWDWPTIDAAAWQRITYVGAIEAPWLGPRPDTPPLQPWMVPVAGVGGMLTPSYRWQQIELDTEAWWGAANRGHDYYVRQEVGIDALGDHPRLREAWEAYLVEMARRAHQWRPDPTILWSPYAWDRWDTVSGARRASIESAMAHLVHNVRKYSGLADDLRLIIDLQDGRGAQPSEPATDAINWYELIKKCGAEVRINAEWFKQDLTPQDPLVMADRLELYAEHDVPVGVCWHARDFLVPPPPVPQPIVNHLAIS